MPKAILFLKSLKPERRLSPTDVSSEKLGLQLSNSQTEGWGEVRGYLLRTTCGLLASEQVVKVGKSCLETHYILSDVDWLKKVMCLWAHKPFRFETVDKLKGEYRLVLCARFVILDLKKILPVQKHVVFSQMSAGLAEWLYFSMHFALLMTSRHHEKRYYSWNTRTVVKQTIQVTCSNPFFSICRCTFHTHHADYMS